jgi:hypothetical protein
MVIFSSTPVNRLSQIHKKDKIEKMRIIIGNTLNTSTNLMNFLNGIS